MRSAAVILHGAGSTGAFVAAAMTADDLGVDVLIAPDYRGGSDVGVETLRHAIRSCSAEGLAVEVIGGISLGAHSAARMAREQHGLRSVVLAMPAWTGDPGPVGAATVAAGEEVAALGSAAVLERLTALHPTDWVVTALAQAWPAYGDTALVDSLRRAGQSRGPTSEELRALTVPAVVVALRDDPLHPLDTAREWAESIPGSELVELPRDLGGGGPCEIGRAAAIVLSGSR